MDQLDSLGLLTMDEFLEIQRILKEKRRRVDSNVVPATINTEVLGLSIDCGLSQHKLEGAAGEESSASTNTEVLVEVSDENVSQVGEQLQNTASVHEDPKQNSNEADLSKKQPFIWKESQTLLLIETYKAHEYKFADVKYKKKHVWEVITNDIHKHGYFPTSAQCEGRWKTITATFKRHVDHNRVSGNDRRECGYFQQLSELYGYRPSVTPVVTLSSSGKGDTRRQYSTNAVQDDERVEEEDQEVPVDQQDENPASAPSKNSETAQEPLSKKSRKYTSNAAATAQLMVDWLDEYKEEKKRAEEEKMAKAQQMPSEKMSILKDLVNILKNN